MRVTVVLDCLWAPGNAVTWTGTSSIVWIIGKTGRTQTFSLLIVKVEIIVTLAHVFHKYF